MRSDPVLSRRSVIAAGLGAGAGLLFGTGCSDTPLAYEFAEPDAGPGRALVPTRACADGDAPVTLSEIEGPFYTPRTPERRELAPPDSVGLRLQLVGRVMTPECEPVAGAVLDFWQADPAGTYDNDGFRLRGHQFTDASGAYALGTLKPGSYSDGFIARTPHLHVKVQGPQTALLTTQLYFPQDAAQNAGDRFFHEQLLLTVTSAANGVIEARFDFVLEALAT